MAGLKIFGLFVGLNTLKLGAHLVSAHPGNWGPGEDFLFWNGLYVVASGALALVLLLWTERVAKWLLGSTAEREVETDGDPGWGRCVVFSCRNGSAAGFMAQELADGKGIIEHLMN